MLNQNYCAKQKTKLPCFMWARHTCWIIWHHFHISKRTSSRSESRDGEWFKKTKKTNLSQWVIIALPWPETGRCYLSLLLVPRKSSGYCKPQNTVPVQARLWPNLRLTEGYHAGLTDWAGKTKKQDLFRFGQFIIYIESKSKIWEGVKNPYPCPTGWPPKQRWQRTKRDPVVPVWVFAWLSVFVL